MVPVFFLNLETLPPDPYLSLYDCNRVKLLSSPVEHFFPTQFLPSFPTARRVTWPVLTPAGPIKQQPLSSGSDTRGADAYSAYGSSAKFLRRSSALVSRLLDSSGVRRVLATAERLRGCRERGDQSCSEESAQICWSQ